MTVYNHVISKQREWNNREMLLDLDYLRGWGFETQGNCGVKSLLISILYIENTNEYIEQGYGYGLPSPLMTSNINIVNQ